MFGEHELEIAKLIAKEKSLELGAECKVVPSPREPGKYTVAVPVHVAHGKQFPDEIRRITEK